MEQNRDFVSSLAKGLAVIQAFGPERSTMTLTEVATESGLSRASARRLLLTLQALEFVSNSGRKFQLTPRVLDLGYSFLSSHNFIGVIQHSLEDVTRRLEESCSVGVLNGDEVVYVARSAAKHRLMSISLSIGSRLPAATTSMGRVLLAALDDTALQAFLDRVELPRYTDHTVTDKQQLRARLLTGRRQDYAIVDQELEPALRSLAVPVRTPAGNVVAAVNVSTNAGRVSLEDLTSRFLPALQACATSIGPYMT